MWIVPRAPLRPAPSALTCGARAGALAAGESARPAGELPPSPRLSPPQLEEFYLQHDDDERAAQAEALPPSNVCLSTTGVGRPGHR